MFIGIDKCSDQCPVKNVNTLTFVLSEVSMAFSLNYCENGILKRSFAEVDDNRFKDIGDKMDVENETEYAGAIIWNQMGIVLGKQYWDIDPSEKATRYFFVKEDELYNSKAIVNNKVEKTEIEVTEIKKLEVKKPEVKKSEVKISEVKISEVKISEVKISKKWWEFWK